MIFHIGGVLDAARLQDLRTRIDALAFVDGRLTAGWHARTVKDNRQASPSAELAAIQAEISDILLGNDVIRAFALPARLLPPLISRYSHGDSYGPHVDDAVMGRPPLRTDLSLTLFLNEPDSYDGGELEVLMPAGSDTAKFAAGDVAIYPSTTLHRVTPVTAGERLVAVSWIQSLVRGADEREILFDLDRARRTVFNAEGKSDLFDTLAKSYANLLRLWATP